MEMRYLLFIILTVVAYCCKAADYGLKSAPVVVSWSQLSSIGPDKTGLIAWYKADGESYGNNDPVTILHDYSGNVNNLTNVGGNAPSFQVNRINSKPTVMFIDHNNTELRRTTLSGYGGVYNGLAITACFKSTSGNVLSAIGFVTVLDRYVSPTLYYEFRVANATEYGGIPTIEMLPPGGIPPAYSQNLTMTQFYILTALYNGSTITMSKTNSLEVNTTANVSKTLTFDYLNIGVITGTSYYWDGELAELLIYNLSSVFTPGYTNTMRYLTNKYGLTP